MKLFNRTYKVSASLAKHRVEVRYDPEHLHEIEIYLNASFRQQKAKPLRISPHRSPKELLPVEIAVKYEISTENAVKTYHNAVKRVLAVLEAMDKANAVSNFDPWKERVE
jgi:hypothetical protein